MTSSFLIYLGIGFTFWLKTININVTYTISDTGILTPNNERNRNMFYFKLTAAKNPNYSQMCKCLRVNCFWIIDLKSI